ncbi:ATP-binding protein [Streptomyces sp. NPDC026673]|uniref:ATP-binding protein n=1 Tax=Streptomyces sp. NPDC026673 TaxID=3155724 RepID=UPI0033C8094D
MSLPLARRIARAALLVGAAAAPLIGAGAGAASAAELPQVGDLGGLTNVDKAPDLTGTVNGVAKKSGAVKTVQEAVPATTGTVTGLTKSAQPTVKKTATQAAKTVGGTATELGKTTKAADGSGLPLQGLPGGLPSTGQLPLQGLPIGG